MRRRGSWSIKTAGASIFFYTHILPNSHKTYTDGSNSYQGNPLLSKTLFLSLQRMMGRRSLTVDLKHTHTNTDRHGAHTITHHRIEAAHFKTPRKCTRDFVIWSRLWAEVDWETEMLWRWRARKLTSTWISPQHAQSNVGNQRGWGRERMRKRMEEE